MPRILLLTAAFLLAATPPTQGATLVFETASMRLSLGEDATIRSLTSKPQGVEYVSATERIPMAKAYRGGHFERGSHAKYGDVTQPWVYSGGQTAAASHAAREGNILRVAFDDAETAVTYRVTVRPQYVAFELLEVSGPPVDRIDLLCLKLVGLPDCGAWVNLAFGPQFGVCLCAGNVKTNAELVPSDRGTLLRAVAERQVGLEGTVAVLFGCSEPSDRFLDVMATVERDFHMPAGAENRRHPDLRLSYLWAKQPTPENIDQYVSLAKRGGFRTILFSYTAFSTGAGHYEWNGAYPHGIDDLRKVTDAIRDAGLKTGLHIHYSKAHKSDPYVTPVPDSRLHHIRRFTLSEDVDAETDTLPIDEDPVGCTLDDDRRLVQVGNELVAYKSYRAESPFAFLGCGRGQLGTLALAHRRGDRVGLLDVDTWPAFVRFDQDTDIQDEVARRIAEIYAKTGPYDMVYFDGAEDVHWPFWYHVASAQQRVYRCLKPPPPVCESALYSHFSWHMITRSNAYDVVAPAGGMKDFCRLMPCPTAAERAKDFSRIDFGWLGRFGEKAAGPDVWEYVASRAAAWDCPLSLHVALPEVSSNPRWQDCLDVIRVWEDARLGRCLADAD
ncbi:MAG: hypothetical protein ACYC6Y_23060, partial [Thermoguttaceae bacterium]